MGIHNLKPCPFCGGTAKILVAPVNQKLNIAAYAVYCTQCNAMMGYADPYTGTTEFFKSAEDAAEMWNTRTYII